MRVFTLLSRLAMMACLLFAVSSCEEDFSARKGKNGKGVGSIDGELLGVEKSYILVAQDDLPSGLEKKIADMGGEVVSVTPEAGIAVVKSSKPNFKNKASKLSGIYQVVTDFKIQLTAPTKNVELEADAENPPNSNDDDFFFDLQWGHDAVDAVESWNAGYSGEGARVAVLDGGFDLDHPDLAPNIDYDASANFVDGEDLEYGFPDTFSHGTHVAGTVAAADNGFGIIGVAPKAKLILVKVLGDEGSGSFADVIAGIIHAADVEADVINMSLGAYFFKNGGVLAADGQTIIPVPANEVAALKNAMQKAVNYAYGKGVTVIASAGNDAANGQADGSGLHLPSDLAKVISTSATAPLNWAGNPSEADFARLATYSNFGNKVDFAAPGGDSAYPGNEFCTVAGNTLPCWVFDLVFSTGNGGWYWSAGTSMASPHASGVAAIIVGANGGDMSPAQVEAAMKEYAIDIFKTGRDPQSGHGQVNAVMD